MKDNHKLSLVCGAEKNRLRIYPVLLHSVVRDTTSSHASCTSNLVITAAKNAIRISVISALLGRRVNIEFIWYSSRFEIACCIIRAG